MARVAMLAHVKESTIQSAPSAARVGVRIPWTGGKIVSNKDEALRKFYERKLQNGASTLSPAQRKALEESVAKLGGPTVSSDQATTDSTRTDRKHQAHKSKHDVVHKLTPTTKRMAHRAHVKASSANKKTIIVNGRVVGPRVQYQHNGSQKASAARGPLVAAKKKPMPSYSRPVALQDQLGMSLDALVKRGSK